MNAIRKHYHNSKDIAIALSVESSELLDIFKWKNNIDLKRISTESRNVIADEVADVLIYLLSLANVVSIDLTQAAMRKIKKNARKYPREKPAKW